jgi:hypothetical protein
MGVSIFAGSECLVLALPVFGNCVKSDGEAPG